MVRGADVAHELAVSERGESRRRSFVDLPNLDRPRNR